MALGLGSVLYVALLVINAIAVLHEERFLARIGWSTKGAQSQQQMYSQGSFHDPYGPGGQMDTTGSSGNSAGIKQRTIVLIGAVRTLMRIPLIAINTAVIVYELVLGETACGRIASPPSRLPTLLKPREQVTKNITDALTLDALNFESGYPALWTPDNLSIP